MKIADLVADRRTDALVALAQDWIIAPVKGTEGMVAISKNGNGIDYLYKGHTCLYMLQSGYELYSPSTNPAQWAELIDAFCLSIDQLISGAHNIHVNGYGWVNGADENLKLAICKAVITAEWGDEIPDEIWEQVA